MDIETNNLQKTKPVIKGYTLEELKDYFTSLGEKKFRGEQVFNWFYRHLIDSYADMKNIPWVLREQLSDNTGGVNTLKLSSKISSKLNGTTKYLFQTSDGYKIESVVIPEINRTTLCVSTQVGCPLDCKFCATGLMGYRRNLTSGEIFDQYKFAAIDYSSRQIKNIVYMGMGEPLLNFTETIRSVKIFAENLTPELRLRRITVSTVGIAPKIIELANLNLKVKLAFSLHSCFEDIRSKLIPINAKYSLKENLNAMRYYTNKTESRITFEYVMIEGINDREEDIQELTKLSKTLPCKINVIPFNSLEHMNPKGFSAELRPTSQVRIIDFIKALRDKNIVVTVRNTAGDDIAAACGQLAISEN